MLVIQKLPKFKCPTKLRVTGRCTYHGDYIVVRKLVAEERAKYDALDAMLLGGLCDINRASECGAGDFALVPLSVTRSRSCVFVSTPFAGLLVDQSPRRGLRKPVRGGGR